MQQQRARGQALRLLMSSSSSNLLRGRSRHQLPKERRERHYHKKERPTTPLSTVKQRQRPTTSVSTSPTKSQQRQLKSGTHDALVTPGENALALGGTTMRLVSLPHQKSPFHPFRVSNRGGCRRLFLNPINVGFLNSRLHEGLMLEIVSPE